MDITDYNYIKELTLDNVEKNKILLDNINELINILDNINNDNINKDIVKLVHNNNIKQLNGYSVNELNNMLKTIKYSNFDTFITFLNTFINLYRYTIDIYNQFRYICNLITINYSNYSITFSDTNLINNTLNIIESGYVSFNNYSKKNMDDIHKFFISHIDKYITEIELYKFMSNILSLYPNTIELYVILFNKGIEKNNSKIYQQIIEIYNNDKDAVLNIKYNIKIKETINIHNYLQTFSMVPKFMFDNKNNILELSDIIYKTLNIKTNITDNVLDVLNISIKNYSNINKIPTSISIVNIDNNVDYIVENLLNNNIKVDTTQGLNNNIIKQFKTINISDNKKVKKDKIININYNENTQQTIVLQTVDFNKFKVYFYKDNYLIPCIIFNKIIRNIPSKRIEKYNENFENEVIEYQSTEYVKQYIINKYLDFNVIEQSSNKLYKELSNNIINSILSKFSKPNLTNIELFNIINNNKVGDILDTHLNNFYNDIISDIGNIDNKLLNDIYISYLSLYDNLLFKFNKIISDKYNYYSNNKNIDNTKKFEMIIRETVGAIINQKTDIYNYIIEKYNILKNYKQQLHS